MVAALYLLRSWSQNGATTYREKLPSIKLRGRLLLITFTDKAVGRCPIRNPGGQKPRGDGFKASEGSSCPPRILRLGKRFFTDEAERKTFPEKPKLRGWP